MWPTIVLSGIHDHSYASKSIRHTFPHTGGGQCSQPTRWTNHYSNRVFLQRLFWSQIGIFVRTAYLANPLPIHLVIGFLLSIFSSIVVLHVWILFIYFQSLGSNFQISFQLIYTWKKFKHYLRFYEDILNYNLSIFYLCLIKIFFRSVIRSIQGCFYVKMNDIQRSIWQTAAILDSANLFLCSRRHWYFLQ